jgi:sensor histidine kinase regulating citrate/malate metabolism
MIEKKNDIVTTCNVEDYTEAFKLWLELTRYIHNLTNMEMDVLAVLLRRRHELSPKVTDEELLNEYLFSNIKIRREMNKELGFDSDTRLPNVLSALRKKGAIVGNIIHPAFIPAVTQDFKEFSVKFIIKVNGKR